MEVEIKRLSNEHPIDAITLRSDRLRVEIWTLGARLNAVHLDEGPNLAIGSGDVNEALGQRAFYGSIVGPVANRLTDGMATLDGRQLKFEAHGVRHFLHSGPDGTQAQIWDISQATASTAHLILNLPNGLGGFPGARQITARYEIDGLDLRLTLEAISDAPSLMNPAHHPYWLVNGDAPARLTVTASEYLPVDNETLPTGAIKGVEGTEFDHQTARAPTPNIDNNYCRTASDTPTFAARLEGDVVSLDILTTAPGLQVFTGRLPGIAIEPQLWPDAPNHSNFPSIRLAPGETFRQQTIYRFQRA